MLILKNYFKKKDPKVTMYRNYKLFDYESCSSAHENKFSKIESLNLNYDIFKNVCLDVVNKCAPLKK